MLFRSGFADGHIKISSILFGLKSYDPGQVLAVVLRDPKPVTAHYELKTRDESRFLVNTLQIDDNAVLLQDSALPGLKIACADLLEIKKR